MIKSIDEHNHMLHSRINLNAACALQSSFQAVLWRKAEVNSPQTVKVPVDSLVKELEVSISGQVVSALLVSPKGELLHLKYHGCVKK